MDDIAKLRVLIPHWLAHNTEHAAEFREWAPKAGEAEADILAAAETMKRVNEALEAALAKLGGPLDYELPH